MSIQSHNTIRDPSSASGSSSSAPTSGTIVGIACGAVGLFIVGAFLWMIYCRRQWQYTQEDMWRRSRHVQFTPPESAQFYTLDHRLDHQSNASNGKYSAETLPSHYSSLPGFGMPLDAMASAMPAHPAYIPRALVRRSASSRGTSPAPTRSRADGQVVRAFLDPAEEEHSFADEEADEITADATAQPHQQRKRARAGLTINTSLAQNRTAAVVTASGSSKKATPAPLAAPSQPPSRYQKQQQQQQQQNPSPPLTGFHQTMSSSSSTPSSLGSSTPDTGRTIPSSGERAASLSRAATPAPERSTSIVREVSIGSKTKHAGAAKARKSRLSFIPGRRRDSCLDAQAAMVHIGGRQYEEIEVGGDEDLYG